MDMNTGSDQGLVPGAELGHTTTHGVLLLWEVGPAKKI